MSPSLNVSRRSIAGNTAQKPSQYRHELQITRRRSPSAMRSVTGGTRSLHSRDSPKHRPDSHAKSCEITLSENVACHDLTSCEYVRPAAKSLYRGPLVDFHPKVGERDSRP